MVRSTLFALSTLLVAQAVLAEQSWTPLVAKHRTRIETVRVDGSNRQVTEWIGDYLRTSTGKVLKTDRTVVNGVAGDVTGGSFEDLVSGKIYQLMYKSRRAVLRGAGSTRQPLTDEYKALSEQHAVDKQPINGVWCLGFPVISGETGERIGTGWRSMDLDLHVKTESAYERNRERVNKVREFYDIQAGIEPLQGVVRIPEGFEVVEGPIHIPQAWEAER